MIWEQADCPTCKAWAGERCRFETPSPYRSGHDAVHWARAVTWDRQSKYRHEPHGKLQQLLTEHRQRRNQRLAQHR